MQTILSHQTAILSPEDRKKIYQELVQFYVDNPDHIYGMCITLQFLTRVIEPVELYLDYPELWQQRPPNVDCYGRHWYPRNFVGNRMRINAIQKAIYLCNKKIAN